MIAISKDGSAFEGNQKQAPRELLFKMLYPFLDKIFVRMMELWKRNNPNIFTKTIEEYRQDFKFSLTNMENYSIFLAPGMNMKFDDTMRRVHKMSSLNNIP